MQSQLHAAPKSDALAVASVITKKKSQRRKVLPDSAQH